MDRKVRRLPAYRPGVKMVNLSGQTLQWIGFVLVCLSSFSIAILQRTILGLDGEGSMEAVSEAMKPGGTAMGWATGAVFCSLASTLAIPIFAKVVYEGWKRAANPVRYLQGLAACALVSDIPYDFAMNGKILDWSAQNPVWGLLLAVLTVEILRRFQMRSKAANTAFRVLIVFAALVWALLLRIQVGTVMVMLVTLFYLAEKKPNVTIAGGVLLTLMQFPAPLGMLFVHWYDAEKEDGARKLLCVLYPVQLLVFGVLALVLKQGGM